MQRQIVLVVEAYGSADPALKINNWLQAHPDYEIKPGQIYATPLAFAGEVHSHGITVVFSLREGR